MARANENWERLVEATLRREELKLSGQRTPNEISPASLSPSSSFNFTSSLSRVSFTYHQVLQATNYLSKSNLIKQGHSGDLYYGVLECGIQVIVKKIDISLANEKSYLVPELEIFNKVSHSREDVLKDEHLKSLDWMTSLKIAIGTAEGLRYLHHECDPPLVHRDVKASSILLDDKFEVRLGSLGEVCTQEEDNHQHKISRLLQLPQTSEQGAFGTPNATCAYDVYCVGKVLLELVTGKAGISASSGAAAMTDLLEQTLPYISIYEKDLVTTIVDLSLIIDEDLLEEVWAMAIIAKSCLNPNPLRRPLMRYILIGLENPLKVVREEYTSSARLRTTSSRSSWNAALFGSWRHSS